MRTYQVWLKADSKCIELKADDVNVDVAGMFSFWNFTVVTEEDAVTVAGFPVGAVDYVTSV